MKLSIFLPLLGLASQLMALALPEKDVARPTFINDGNMPTSLSYAVDADTGIEILAPFQHTVDGNNAHQVIKCLSEAGPDIEAMWHCLSLPLTWDTEQERDEAFATMHPRQVLHCLDKSISNIDALADCMAPTMAPAKVQKHELDHIPRNHPILDFESTLPFVDTLAPMNYCGDTVGWTVSDGSGPDVADCLALQNQVDHTWGYFNWPGDSKELDEYHLLASYGTCGLFIMPWNANISTKIGNGDVGDLLRDAAQFYPNQAVYNIFSCTPPGTTTNWAIMGVTP